MESSKQLIQTLSMLSDKFDKMKLELDSIKLDLARNERVNKLEIKMAGMEVRVWVLFSVLMLVASAMVGYFFKTHG